MNSRISDCLAISAIAVIVAYAAVSRVGPSSAYPPATVTGDWSPAVTQANIKTTVCVSGYTATVRAVNESTKKAVLKRDGKTQTGCCEVDHFVSLELGGSNNPDKNLWAQPYSGRYGARVKDVVETALKRQICSGKMTLDAARSCITSDWIACGLKIGAVK